jgi:hypothetical protein
MNLELKELTDTLVGVLVGILLGLLTGANIGLYLCRSAS